MGSLSPPKQETPSTLQKTSTSLIGSSLRQKWRPWMTTAFHAANTTPPASCATIQMMRSLCDCSRHLSHRLCEPTRCHGPRQDIQVDAQIFNPCEGHGVMNVTRS